MKQIFVHDQAMPAPVLQAVQGYFAAKVRWQFGWPQGLSDPFSHWNIDFLGTPLKSQTNVEAQLLSSPELSAVADVWRALKAGPMRGHYLLRCYANAHTYGVEGHPHTDIVDATQVDNFTAVVYLNPVWKKEWAGELVLFNAAGDTLCGILPRSGRVAMIPGDIVHAARGVSRSCPAVRICVAFKSRLPTAAEQTAQEGEADSVITPALSATSPGAVISPPLHLWVEPHTRRVAYASIQPDAPTRIFVYEGAQQQLERVLVPSQLQRVVYTGLVPAQFYAQTSWRYAWVDGGLHSVD